MPALSPLPVLLVAMLLQSPAAAGKCPGDPNDPFDAGAAMPSGPFKGRCMDTREQRSIRLLPEREASARGLPAGPGWLYMANVRHAGRFWIAAVDPGAVDQVILQTEFFPAVVPAAHTQLRFHFRRGGEPTLAPQRLGDHAPRTRLGDLIFSVEAVSVVGGEGYDLVKGAQDHFGAAYRFVSLEDRYRKMVVKDRHRVEQARLELTARQRHDLFAHAAHLGDRAQMKLVYHTLNRNCTTELLRAIDRAVTYDATHRVLKGAAFPLRGVPTEMRRGLRLRGLLGPGDRSRLPDLDREVASRR